MAIVPDNTSSSTISSSGDTTFALNVAGSNRILWVSFVTGAAGTPLVSTVKFNGATMTATAATPVVIDANTQVYLYYLVNPDTGNNNIVIHWTTLPDNGTALAASYTGARQTSVPDTQMSAATTGTSATLTTNTLTDNAWLVGVFRNNADGSGTAGANTTIRVQVGGQVSFADTNAAQTPTGSKSIAETFSNAAYGAAGASFAPVGAVVTTLPYRTLLGVGI